MNKLVVASVFLMFTLQACTSCVTSRENFRVHLSVDVGRHIDKVNPYGFATNSHFVESKLGKDGLLEYWYKFDTRQGECVYVYKIDPDTKIIKGWVIENDGGGCFVVP